MDNRYKHTVQVIRFPEGFEEESRGLKVCCRKSLKLASQTDDDPAINDITGVAIPISNPADTVNFVIEKCGITLPLLLLGDVGVYPEDPSLVGFMFDWRQYLLTYGNGTYKISIEFVISGVAGGYLYGTYDLKNYSIPNAKSTVRVWSAFNSYNQKMDRDFSNSNHRDSIRFFGFFGNRQPNTEVKNLITTGRVSEKSTRENVNIYTLSSDPIDVVTTKDLIDMHLLNEDKCLITDHNVYNHDYNLFDVPVVLEDAIDIDYLEFDRGAKVIAKFGDRQKVDKSYFNLK